MTKDRKIVVPLPFADLTITLRGNRRARPMLWYVLFSALFHVLTVAGFLTLFARALFPAAQHPQELVAISSAVRIEQRPRPIRAHTPVPEPRAIARQERTATTHQMTVTHRELAAPRRELSTIRKVAYNPPVPAHSETLTKSQIQAQTQMFAQTIAQARAANDPVAGAASTITTPAAPKQYSLNIEGDFGKPQPEGVLYPLKRWLDDGWVYYYVRYTAEYADGSTESGLVPWPIRFPAGADPFAHDRHRMPLPGPMADYVASGDTQMNPLVKNCYDHRYDYCPIAHE